MNAGPSTAAPSSPHGVMCPHCDRRFLAPTDQPNAVIECPHCRNHAQRRSYRNVPHHRSAGLRAGRSRAAWSAVGAGLLALGVLGTVGIGLQRLHPTADRPRSNHPAASGLPTDSSGVEDLVLQEARTAAEKALACVDWQTARPLILDADRLAPVMEAYHARHPWTPISLDGPHTGSVATAKGIRTARVTVRTDRGSLLNLHLQHTPEGWKLDWERLVNARQFAWQTFHEKPPATAVALHVLARRGSANDIHFTRAGLTPETGIAIHLDGPRPGQPALAVVPKASDLGRLFQRELTWEHPRPYRCHLRMIEPTLVPPCVEIVSFDGEGWDEP